MRTKHFKFNIKGDEIKVTPTFLTLLEGLYWLCNREKLVRLAGEELYEALRP